MTGMSADAVLTLLDTLPILAPEGRRVLRALPRHLTPQDALRELARRGALTSMQADWLLAGRGQELILGPFTLLDRLGEGGMGVVYRARHRDLGRLQAVKLMAERAARDEKAVARIRREAQATATLHHPNIVAIHDAGEAGGRFYLAFELVPGQDLQRLVERVGPLPARQACEYVMQAAEGMQHAHERGLIHRDIKPSNLLLSSDGTVKVADLGLAGWRADLTPTNSDGTTAEGVILGTPDFMAPEQADDPRTCDIRADVYALGCTLYYLLAGEPPFPGGTFTAKLLRHRDEAPHPPAGLPPGLWAVLAKALAKRPQDRHATPGEFASALDPFALGEPLAPPPAPLDPTGPDSPTVSDRPRKTPTRPWWRGAALIALPVVALVAWWLVPPRTAPGDPKATPILPMAAEERQPWHPPELVAVLGDARWRHWGPASSLSVDKAGRRVASRGKDEYVRIWDGATGRPVAALPLAAHAGDAVAIDDKGEVAAAGGNGGEVWIWEAPGWKPTRQKRHTADVIAAAFRPGSRVLASGCKGGVVRWGGIAEGDKLEEHPCGGVQVLSLAWREDGALAAGDSDGAIHLLGLPEGGTPRTIWTGRKGVLSLAFATDGRLTSAHRDGSVCLWDTRSGKLVTVCGRHEGGFAVGVAVSPDGKWLASAGWDDRCLVYDAASGKPAGEVSFRRRRPNALAWMPGPEPTLLVAAEDGLVSAWSPTTRKRIREEAGHTGPVEALLWLPSGELASVASDHHVRVWALDTGRRRSFSSGLEAPGYCLAMSEGLLAVGGMGDRETVCLLDLGTGERRGALRFPGTAYSLCPLGDGRLLVAGGARQAEVWDVRRGERVEALPESGKECWSAVADGGRIAVGDGGYGGDAAVRLFDSGLKPAGVYEGHHNAVNALASHSGRLASGDMRGQVFVDGRPVGKPLRGFIADLAWSVDGRHLAVATGRGEVEWRGVDGVRVTGWDLPGAVKSLAVTPDGRHLLTGNGDGTIFVLRLPAGR